ncbi:hypothetical protein A7A76_23040 [Lysobacter enzymogenes]|uniref:beta-propeller domain-containing protein n=1 Tax=Lysobacter enzymogenes TaxID=69 RepID=UPI0019D16F81|nr:beta-propeller domain-containing protein [Lysobacter enzymogenes]MBN7137580.1 hypothetical protein [Lysobacter enzymogenes]
MPSLPLSPRLSWPLAAALLLSACQPAPAPPPAAAAPQALPAFADDKALSAAFAHLRREAELYAPALPAPMEMPPAPMPMADAAPAAASDAITNVQTAGVDEGDIVKKHGDYLIVLRRGRLFSLDIGGGGLRARSSVDAFAPGTDPSGTWYDEMLVADGQVVVIGYSYERGGTEIGLFDLSADGGLSYRATYHLRSSDYYSASNYASRLIGKQLIFYAPMSVHGYDEQHPEASLPALRRWRTGALPSEFERLLPAQRIYYGPDSLDAEQPTLHTVTVCDLGGAPMRCRSSAALGEPGRSFYVAGDAVYVWTQNPSGPAPDAKAKPAATAARRPGATVYRLPLDGSAPGALRADGAPIDQMSFLERDGWLNVLVASEGRGEGMWAAQVEPGDLALLRVRLNQFGDGRGIAAASNYRPLPEAGGQPGSLHARYIGDWLVFGFGAYWGDDGRRPQGLYALRYARREPTTVLPLPHWVERVDALGEDAIAIGPAYAPLPPASKSGPKPVAATAPQVAPQIAPDTAPQSVPVSLLQSTTGAALVEEEVIDIPPVPMPPPLPPVPPIPDQSADSDLHFTSLRLDAGARIAGDYVQSRAAQADQRSHGFFYRADSAGHGVLGLPTLGADARGRFNARVLYLRNQELALSPLGELASRRPAGSDSDDGCVASCMDWYGNARPIFVGPRVFALLGYELVEGREQNGRIVEQQRVDFTPRTAVAR